MPAAEPSGDIWEAPPPPSPPMTGLGFLFREMVKRGIRVYGEYNPEEKCTKWRLQGKHGEEWTDDWQSNAGTLKEVIESSDNYFIWGILGKSTGHDFLECNKCGEVQLTDKKNGAPSANRKCLMTFKCEGRIKRFDEGVFEVMKPGKRRSGGGARGQGSTKKGIPMDIRKETLEIYDRTGSLSEAARQMRAKYPEWKISPAQVSYWRGLREDNPDAYK